MTGQIQINDLLERYASLLAEVDGWFDSCVKLYPGLIACRLGCAECCRGLFDITLLDALLLKQGFDLLAEADKDAVRRKSSERLDDLSGRWPEFIHPWILNRISEDVWEEMMPEDDGTPCPLLSVQGNCMTYAHRPMTCRLNGIPLIDVSGAELSDEWCSLNFAGTDPVNVEDIRHQFYDLFRQELLLFRELTRRLSGRAVNEMDTIIPGAVLCGLSDYTAG